MEGSEMNLAAESAAGASAPGAETMQYLAGARALVEWGQALPEGVSFATIEAAMEAFAAHLRGEPLERLPVGRMVQVPPGWVAIPLEPDRAMLERFQSGFAQELRNRKKRVQTAEQAGLKAMLKHKPALPAGWTY